MATIINQCSHFLTLVFDAIISNIIERAVTNIDYYGINIQQVMKELLVLWSSHYPIIKFHCSCNAVYFYRWV